MTRRLVGVADMTGGSLDTVLAVLALASAMTGRAGTESDVRSMLRHRQMAEDPGAVREVLRPVTAPERTTAAGPARPVEEEQE